MRKFKAGVQDAGVRADIFLVSKYPDFTRSSLERLFDEGLVKINGKKAKPAEKVAAGEELEVDEKYLQGEPPAIDLPIIYEDENVIVINKPAGVLTHSKGALNLEGTVASFIAPKVISMHGNRAGIVHRLDRGTSGVIICAKNPQTLTHLQRQFSNRKVHKLYEAIAEGELVPKSAIIDAPIKRNPSRPQIFQVAAGGKPSITEYEVEDTFNKHGSAYSLIRIKPRTGRTHQLRVHLKYIGHPIAGDHVYGSGDGGLMLHAKSLELTLPDGKRQTFSAPTPASFEEFKHV